MTGAVLILRPVEDVAETAAMVTAAGFDPLVSPLMTIVDTHNTLPEASHVHALIFSSGHGVRAFARLRPNPLWWDKTVYAVGEHTATIARQSGFKTIVTANGMMAGLIPLIKADGVSPDHILHVRGADIRADPAQDLPGVRALVLYKAVAAETLPVEITQALRGGGVRAVLFYSARSAAIFMDLVKKSGLSADINGVRALCLAHSVLESIPMLNRASIRIASTPDQDGMRRLLDDLKMTNEPSDLNAIHNAEAVIERFGGIRPMAAKTNIPVTTVQGWKKRNTIPGNRRSDVVNAARVHGVRLDDLLTQPGAPVAATSPMPVAPPAPISNPVPPPQQAPSLTREAMMKEIQKSQNEAEARAIRKSVVACAALLGVFAVIGGMVVAVGKQKIQIQEQQIAAIEQQVLDTPASAGDPYARPPTDRVDAMMRDLGQRYNDLRDRTEALQGSVQDLKTKAEGLIDPANGTLMDRVVTLEQTLKNLTGGQADLSQVLSRIQSMQNSVEGQGQLQATITNLQTLVTGLQGRMDQIEPALAAEQQSDSALGQALEGVSPQELKAAAMLIGLSQFRDSMNRSGPFKDDLVLLQTMVGTQDPELNAAIEALAPYAEQGVLSPGGLSNELKTLTGDIVVASLSGQDVSIQDKAMARFNDMLKIRKDGQPINGTDTQATVARAQALLDQGDVDAAVLELQALQGPARQTAQPFIERAEATQMAQQVQSMLTGTVLTQIKRAAASAKNGMNGGATPYVVPRPVIGPFLGTTPNTIQPPIEPETQPAPAQP